MMTVTIPLRLGRGQNNREHYMARHRRQKAERTAVSWLLVSERRPALPCAVRVVRILPRGKPLDDDNLTGSCRAVRDEIAVWLGVDDGCVDLVTYTAHQERGPWGVRIEVETKP
jgi:hypothetical protein